MLFATVRTGVSRNFISTVLDPAGSNISGKPLCTLGTTLTPFTQYCHPGKYALFIRIFVEIGDEIVYLASIALSKTLVTVALLLAVIVSNTTASAEDGIEIPGGRYSSDIFDARKRNSWAD